MRKMSKKRKVLILAFALILPSVFVLGCYYTTEGSSGLSGLLRGSMSYPAEVSVNINRMINRDTESGSPEREEGREDRENFLFLSGRASAFSGGDIVTVLLMSMVFLCLVFTFSEYKKRNNKKLSRMRYYSKWRSNFLSPVWKIIRNRANDYDITRIKQILGIRNPAFVASLQNAGFFMGKMENKAVNFGRE